MTKYTKVIAALGVAAGLGVASLPAAGVFAAEDTVSGTGPIVTTEASGDRKVADVVTINAKVSENLSMSIDADTVGASDPAVVTSTATELGSTAINVKTNAAKGYKITATATSLDNSLGSTDEYKFAYDASIAAGKWTAYKGSDAITSGTAFDTTSAPTAAAGTDYTVTYKAQAAGNQAAGNYQGTITYTVEANALD